jgi:hypothetical protein
MDLSGHIDYTMIHNQKNIRCNAIPSYAVLEDAFRISIPSAHTANDLALYSRMSVV